MLQKRVKNNSVHLWLALACVCLTSFFASAPAHAYNFAVSQPYLWDQVTGNTCPGAGCNQVLTELQNPVGNPVEACPGNGLTRRIVPCIRDVILSATNDFILPFSAYLAGAVEAACILAVILWAVKMVSGSETAPLRDAMVMAIKVGMVILFTYNFGTNPTTGQGSLDRNNIHGGNFGVVLDIMEELLTTVTGYVLVFNQFGLLADCPNWGDTYLVYRVWDAVDCAIDTLLGGIFSPMTLSSGAIGFITATLFSNSLGFTIGLTAFYLIYKFLFAIYKCVYIFITAYMGVAFMVIVSPLFIPAILFKPTKSYFDKWLKIFISFILQPVILFAYMAMLLCAFDYIVFWGPHSLYGTLVAGDPCFYVAYNAPCPTSPSGMGYSEELGTWLYENGIYTDKDMAGQAIGINVKEIKEAGLLPKNAKENGLVNKITQQMVSESSRKQKGLMKTLGIDGGDPKFFEMDIPQRTIDWDKLTTNWNTTMGTNLNSLSYILNVLVAAFMSLITAYIFVDMMAMIPFIGSGVANFGRGGENIQTSLFTDKGGTGTPKVPGLSGMGGLGGGL